MPMAALDAVPEPAAEPIGGRYRLLRLIGQGGMGMVYAADDLKEGRQCAVKLLPPESTADPERRRRFLHEGALLTRFQHPHIVQVFDYGVSTGTAGEVPYLAMELCLGPGGQPFTLKHLQERSPQRQVPGPLLERLIPAVLSAVAVLHAAGLIHRDLKPENILLTGATDDTLVPKLSDFGLVAITGDQDLRQQMQLSLSLSGQRVSERELALVGTYAYMSPEQKRGALLDARSDVYSLGLVLYRLATGYERVGFELPSAVVPDLPPWVDEVVKAAISEDPQARAASAVELCQLLTAPAPAAPLRAPDSAPASALPAGPEAPPATAMEATVSQARPAPLPPRRRHRLLLAAALALALGLTVRLASEFTLRQPAVPPAVTLAELRQRLPDASPGARNALLWDLALTPDGTLRAAGAELLPLLSEGLPAHRRQVLALLRRAGCADQPLRRLLTAALANHDPVLSRPAAHALAGMGAEAADSVPTLFALWRDGPPEQRALTTEVLLHVRVPVQAEYAAFHLAQGDVGALVALGEEAFPVLLGGALADEQETRDTAVAALARLGADGAPVLRDLIQVFRNSPPRRGRALAALTRAGRPVAGELATLLLLKDPTLRLATLSVLNSLALDETPDLTLLYLAEDDAEALKHLAAKALPALITALAAEDPGMRIRAVVALIPLRSQAAPAIPGLIHLLARSTDAADAALRTEVATALGASGPENLAAVRACLNPEPTTWPPALAAMLRQAGRVQHEGEHEVLDAELTRDLARALAAAGVKPDERLLTLWADDYQDPFCAKALVAAGLPAAPYLMDRGLREPEPPENLLALLKQLGPDLVPFLAAAVCGRTDGLSVTEAEAIRRWYPVGKTPAAAPPVRRLALRALARLGPTGWAAGKDLLSVLAADPELRRVLAAPARYCATHQWQTPARLTPDAPGGELALTLAAIGTPRARSSVPYVACLLLSGGLAEWRASLPGMMFMAVPGELEPALLAALQRTLLDRSLPASQVQETQDVIFRALAGFPDRPVIFEEPAAAPLPLDLLVPAMAEAARRPTMRPPPQPVKEPIVGPNAPAKAAPTKQPPDADAPPLPGVLDWSPPLSRLRWVAAGLAAIDAIAAHWPVSALPQEPGAVDKIIMHLTNSRDVAMAAEELRPLGRDGLSAFLSWAREQPKQRELARAALLRLGAPAVPALGRLIRDRDRELGAFALEVLGAIGRPAAAAMPVLYRAYPQAKSGVLRALGGIGPDLPEARILVVCALEDPDAEVQNEAAKVTAAFGPPMVPYLNVALIGDDDRRQVRAAAALGEIVRRFPDVPADWPALGDLLTAKPEVAKAAAAALNSARPAVDQQVAQLVRTLQDSEPQTRLDAARTLGRLAQSPTTVIPALEAVRRANRDDADLQREATAAIERLRLVDKQRPRVE